MRWSKGRIISSNNEWENFNMVMDKLDLPTGQRVSAQEVLAEIALLEIGSELELKTTSKLLKHVRAIANIRCKKGA